MGHRAAVLSQFFLLLIVGFNSSAWATEREKNHMTHQSVRDIVERLKLKPHPEGGYYRETYRSPLIVQGPAGKRSASTVIYFLLPAGDFSGFHRLPFSEEIWSYHDGDPLQLHTIVGTEHNVRILGRNLVADENLHHVVPPGGWQAAKPIGDRYGYTLCGCTVTPGFEFTDFELGQRSQLVAHFPDLAPVIEALTR